MATACHVVSLVRPPLPLRCDLHHLNPPKHSASQRMISEENPGAQRGPECLGWFGATPKRGAPPHPVKRNNTKQNSKATTASRPRPDKEPVQNDVARPQPPKATKANGGSGPGHSGLSAMPNADEMRRGLTLRP